MSYTFNKDDYDRVGPGGAEDIIGGSVLSDLIADGDHFESIPDDYDLVYYLSKKRFDNGDYDGPCKVVAIYREYTAIQRTFTLDYEQFSHDLDGLGDSVEEWTEVRDG